MFWFTKKKQDILTFATQTTVCIPNNERFESRRQDKQNKQEQCFAKITESLKTYQFQLPYFKRA